MPRTGADFCVWANWGSGGVAGGGWLAMGGLKGVPAGWVWVDFLWRDVFASVGGDKPRRAGVNTLRHLFDKFLKGIFRIMEKRQSSCSPNGANAANRICRLIYRIVLSLGM